MLLLKGIGFSIHQVLGVVLGLETPVKFLALRIMFLALDNVSLTPTLVAASLSL